MKILHHPPNMNVKHIMSCIMSILAERCCELNFSRDSDEQIERLTTNHFAKTTITVDKACEVFFAKDEKKTIEKQMCLECFFLIWTTPSLRGYIRSHNDNVLLFVKKIGGNKEIDAFYKDCDEILHEFREYDEFIISGCLTLNSDKDFTIAFTQTRELQNLVFISNALSRATKFISFQFQNIKPQNLKEQYILERKKEEAIQESFKGISRTNKSKTEIYEDVLTKKISSKGEAPIVTQTDEKSQPNSTSNPVLTIERLLENQRLLKPKADPKSPTDYYLKCISKSLNKAKNFKKKRIAMHANHKLRKKKMQINSISLNSIQNGLADTKLNSIVKHDTALSAFKAPNPTAENPLIITEKSPKDIVNQEKSRDGAVTSDPKNIHDDKKSDYKVPVQIISESMKKEPKIVVNKEVMHDVPACPEGQDTKTIQGQDKAPEVRISDSKQKSKRKTLKSSKAQEPIKQNEVGQSGSVEPNNLNAEKVKKGVVKSKNIKKSVAVQQNPASGLEIQNKNVKEETALDTHVEEEINQHTENTGLANVEKTETQEYEAQKNEVMRSIEPIDLNKETKESNASKEAFESTKRSFCSQAKKVCAIDSSEVTQLKCADELPFTPLNSPTCSDRQRKELENIKHEDHAGVFSKLDRTEKVASNISNPTFFSDATKDKLKNDKHDRNSGTSSHSAVNDKTTRRQPSKQKGEALADEISVGANDIEESSQKDAKPKNNFVLGCILAIFLALLMYACFSLLYDEKKNEPVKLTI
ncbi:hypothetical protein ENBRE01_2832 [Enteropsectra breve]|nr:hypothetical protein ENBRE01_2832 [Enteropsectra breve]